MRKTITLIIILLLAYVDYSTAGDKDKYFGINAGYLYRRGLNANVFFEQEIANHNAYEIYLDLYNQWSKAEDGKIYKDNFWKYNRTWGIGLAYKHALWKGKNSNFRLRFGGDLGTNTHQFVGSLEAGFEMNFVFKNRVQFTISQKNDFVFGGKDHFRNGLLIGFKLPF